MKFTIYIHKNKINGKVYVGLTSKTMQRRWRNHCKKAKYRCKKGNANYFQRAIVKYGKDNWESDVLEICDSLEEAEAAEKKWIAYYKSNQKEFGYNLTDGGRSCFPTPDVKRKISESVKKLWKDGIYKDNSFKIKEWYENNDNPFLGKTHSKEALAKMATASKVWHEENDNPFLGKKHSKLARESMSRAAKKRCADPNWSPPLAGKKHSEESLEKMRGPRGFFSKITAEALLEASQEFDSQLEIAKHFNCTSANISYLTKRYEIRDEFNKNLGVMTADILIELSKSCSTQAEMARHLGYTGSAISYMIKKFDIKEEIRANLVQ